MTENEAVGAEALEPVQVGADVETTQPQENPDAELAEEAGPTGEQTESDADGKPRKKGGFQRQLEKKDADIAKLNDAIQEEARRRHEAELRAQAIERKLAELHKQQPGSLDAEPGAEPKLEEFDHVDDFKQAYAEWARRDGYHKHKQEIEKQRQQHELVAAQAKLETRVIDARKKYTDFDAVVMPIAEIVDANPVLNQYSLQSEMAAEVGYHLGKNPAILAELLRLPPAAQLLELGKLEVKLSAAPPPKPVTSAPAPIKPVGQSEKAAYSHENASMDEFIRRRNEEERKARRG